MFPNNQELPTPKPDPPRVFTFQSIVEIGLCLIGILICVSTLNYVDSMTWHEEKITRHYYLEMDIKCNKKPFE